MHLLKSYNYDFCQLRKLSQVKFAESTIMEANGCKTKSVWISEKERKTVQWGLMYFDASFTDELAPLRNWRWIMCVKRSGMMRFVSLQAVLCSRVSDSKTQFSPSVSSYWLVVFDVNWVKVLWSANPPLENQVHDVYHWNKYGVKVRSFIENRQSKWHRVKI